MNRQYIQQVEALSAEILKQSNDQQHGKRHGNRRIIGICGPPGAGKSTLADALCTALNQQQPDCAVIVPMDGFHLSNEQLEPLGLLPLKGIPSTFDAAGFVDLLSVIKDGGLSAETPPILCPAFDRSIESTVQGAIAVLPQHRIVITEGNYLLLEDNPWSQIKTICDSIYYVDVPLEVLHPRLVERHKQGGKTTVQAEEKVASTDLPNAKLVETTKHHASQILAWH